MKKIKDIMWSNKIRMLKIKGRRERQKKGKRGGKETKKEKKIRIGERRRSSQR